MVGEPGLMVALHVEHPESRGVSNQAATTGVLSKPQGRCAPRVESVERTHGIPAVRVHLLCAGCVLCVGGCSVCAETP